MGRLQKGHVVWATTSSWPSSLSGEYMGRTGSRGQSPLLAVCAPGYSDLSDGGGEAGQKGSPCFLNLPQTVQNTLSRIPLASRASSDHQPRTAMHVHCLGSAGWFSLSLMTMAAAALNSAWSLRVRQQWLQLQLR